MDKYIEIIRIIIDHEYFVGQRCNVIDLYPNSNESRLWKSLNLHLKKIHDDTLSLFLGIGDKDDRKLLLYMEEDAIVLNFNIQTDKSKFLNYTDCPYSSIEDLYVMQVPDREPGNKNIQLSFNEKNVRIIEGEKVSGNLNKLLLAQLEVDIKGDLYHLIHKNEDFEYLQIELVFHVFPMFLEYVIIQRKEWNNKEMELKDKSGGLEFTPLEKIDFLSEENVYRSISKKPVKLCNKHNYQIQLWCKNKANRQLIFADIPIPELEEISIQSGKNKKIITKYIYY